jgi:hypothetical protein
LIRAFFVSVGCLTLFNYRRKLSFAFILTSVWTLLALFAATLSERPYPHYLLQAAAPSAILLGIFFAGKGLVQPLTVIPLLLACLVPVYYKYWYYSTPAYYQRFLNFATGLSSREGYFSQFNQNVLEDYQIANFLVSSSKPSDRAFVWGPDSPVIYALSRRLPPIKFTADYHIKDFSSQKTVAILLSQNRPKFIVLTLQATPFPEINPLLKKEYLPISRMNGTEIWIKSR